MAIHEFFQDQGFIYVHAPIITGNDAEGAGESFKVVTDLKHPEEFFSKEASLTVSGQLHAEAFALAFKLAFFSTVLSLPCANSSGKSFPM